MGLVEAVEGDNRAELAEEMTTSAEQKTTGDQEAMEEQRHVPCDMGHNEFADGLHCCDETGKGFKDGLLGRNETGKGFRDGLLGQYRTGREFRDGLLL